MDDKPPFVHAVYVPHRPELPYLSVLFTPEGAILAEACSSIVEAERHRFAEMAASLPREIGVD